MKYATVFVTRKVLDARDMLKNRKGVTAMEYGVIAAIMVAAVVAAFTPVADALSTLMGLIAGKLVLPA